MKSIFLILSFVIIFCSCSKKTYTSNIATKDSFILKDSVIIKDTTIYVAGQSIVVNTLVHDTITKYDTVIKQNNAQLNLSINKGAIKAKCSTDSLQFVIKNLQKIITNSQQIKTTTATQIVEVDKPKPYIPLWLLIILIVSLLWNFRKIIYKLII